MAAAVSLAGGSCSVSTLCCNTVHSEVVSSSWGGSAEDVVFRALLSGFGRLNEEAEHQQHITCTAASYYDIAYHAMQYEN